MSKESIIKKILALMAKTTENGCTEAEALAASQKVQEMLHQYQLSLSDLELQDSKCDTADYDTMERDSMVAWVANAVAYFTDTRAWSDMQQGYQHLKFFGLEHDILVAEYIIKICDWAMVNGWEAAKDEYPTQGRPKFKKSYMYGMATRLAARIREMKDVQKKSDIETTGRDLVVVKNQIMEDEWAKLGIHLSRGRKSKFSVDQGAYSQGRIDADKVGLNPGVGQHSNAQIR